MAIHAMMATLNTSVFPIRRGDKFLAKELAKSKRGEARAFNVHRDLMDPKASGWSDIVSITKRAGMAHRELTLVWGSPKAPRLLVAALYPKWRETMDDFQKRFWFSVDQFLEPRRFNTGIADARRLLGSAFRQEDYPTRERARLSFRFSYEFEPMPVVQNLADLPLDNQSLKEIMAAADARQHRLMQMAQNAAEDKLIDVCRQVHSNLKGYTPSIVGTQIRKDMLVRFENDVKTIEEMNVLNRDRLRDAIEVCKSLVGNYRHYHGDISDCKDPIQRHESVRAEYMAKLERALDHVGATVDPDIKTIREIDAGLEDFTSLMDVTEADDDD